ncbi:hypothetical protein FHR75_003949 [Kineococcus radiotolerans]|uniref:Uncharacterized protein n=1 Tax=Kineococcus radiotolerans TaxID=131568 RepID=A0A7W4XZ07_KINRA|nr:hypothetical protein [Kineococcus radiotolerans]MBB2903107.1 hypothetical protein [Kineococcus radiotolerans]
MPEEAQQKQLSREVVEALRLLKRGEELTSALRPSSRAPGSLHWSWAPVTADRLRLLTGFAPLRLPARLSTDQREVLAVPGRDGELRLDVDQDGQTMTSVFAALYLPRHLDWRQARTSSVLRANVTAIYVQEADDRPWPLSMLHRRHNMDADGLPIPAKVGGDFTVIEVEGTAVGVQADLSGAVSVGWSVAPTGGAGHRWNVTMLTRRPAVDAVRLVQAAGLLDPPSTTVD